MLEIQKHNFFHMGDTRGGVRCQHCDVERISCPMPMGYRWVSNGEVFVKKPKCIKRFLKTTTMLKFESEILPDGLAVTATADPNMFKLSFLGQSLLISKHEIARLYGIAFPEKAHGSCDLKEPTKNELK